MPQDTRRLTIQPAVAKGGDHKHIGRLAAYKVGNRIQVIRGNQETTRVCQQLSAGRQG